MKNCMIGDSVAAEQYHTLAEPAEVMFEHCYLVKTLLLDHIHKESLDFSQMELAEVPSYLAVQYIDNQMIQAHSTVILPFLPLDTKPFVERMGFVEVATTQLVLEVAEIQLEKLEQVEEVRFPVDKQRI